MLNAGDKNTLILMRSNLPEVNASSLSTATMSET